MDQKYFHGILKKYLLGRATAEEEKIIDSWYAEMDKDHTPLFDSKEESALETKYWSAISSGIAGRNRKIKHPSLIPWQYLGVAASLLIALFSYWYVAYYKTGDRKLFLSEKKQASYQWQKINNSGIFQKHIILPDHSRITLEPKSYVKFPTSFSGAERAVYLEGEAFFEVVRNEQKPFLVYANNLTTKVLGTSFTIKAFKQEKEVIVEVKTGKVSVYTNVENEKAEPAHEIILTPNQKIVYDIAGNKLSRTIVDSPKAILLPEEVKGMRFENAPVKEIFDALEKIYGVDLVYSELTFSSCTLTTTVSDGDIYNRLDIICKAIDARYELTENRIVITGSGCN